MIHPNHQCRVFVLILFISLMFQSGVAEAASQMAIMGDAGKAGSELNRLKASVLQEGIQSLIMPGDNLYSGSYSSVWDNWKNTGFQFDVVAIGNHHAGYMDEAEYFGMPGEFYSKVHNGARFIVLNSDNIFSVNQQFSWLEKEITKATESLIFLVYHHPTFTMTTKHPWTEKKKFQLRMRNFLKEHGSRVTALILGHDHITTFANFGPVPMVLAGSGREARPAQPVNYIEDGFQIQTQFLAEQSQHWVSLEINDEAKEAFLHVVRVKDQKKVCSARIAQGDFQLQSNCP